MSRKKSWISLAVILGMVLMLCSGCGSSSGDDRDGGGNALAENGLIKAGSGRFIEEEVTLPKEIRNIKALGKLSDGSLEVIGETGEKGTCFLLKSQDGGKQWDKVQINGLGKVYRPQTAIAPDGRAILLDYMKEGTVKGKIAETDGRTKDVSFSLPDNTADNQIIQIGYDPQGNLVVLDMNGSLFEVTADGECKKAYDTKGAGIRHFSIVGNLLYAVHEEGILIFDTKAKKALDSEGTLDLLVKKDTKLVHSDVDRGQPLLLSAGAKEDAVVLVWEDGIFHFTRGGSVLEQLADSSMTSLSGGDLILLGLTVINDENIFIAAYDGESDKLFHYTYDKGAAAVPEKELTVYALDDSAFLRQTVKLFQKNNPDIHVKLEFGLTGQDGVTLEDALSKLNTDLLAKKGPDVLILDGLPVDSYISKGILCDLTELVNDIDKKEGIFQGIKEGSKKNGKIYAMPARFLISVVEGDKDTVAAGGTLAALAERAEELKKKSSVKVIRKGSRTLLRDLYYADSAVWQKEDGTLDRDALNEYLTYAKKLYDLNPVSKDNDFQDKEFGDGTIGGEKIGTNDSSGMLSKECQIAFGSLAGVLDLQSMCSMRVQTKTEYCLMNSEKVKSYIPYLMAGIVEGGNSDAAKAFVRELLGKKAGNSASNGIPVNRAAYDAVCEEKLHAQNVKDDTSVAGSTKDGKEFGFSYVDLTREDEDKFTQIIESLTKPSMTNRIIQEMVLEQGDRYLLGEQSLESAVEAIIKKVNLYLAENTAG